MQRPIPHFGSLAAVAAAVALLTACASAPSTPPSLTEARSVVQGIGTDPLVLSHAPLELKRANDALARAEGLHRDKAELASVDSASYVASREAEAALAVARAKRNEESIKAAELERERVRAAAAQATAAAAQNAASNARLEATMAQQAANNAQAQAQASQAQAQMARSQAAAAQADNQALQQQLVELQGQVTDRGMLVTLGDVLFETGRSEVKPGAQDALRKLAGYLNEHPTRRVLIEGFTDSVGSDQLNLTLSERRAQSVAGALVALGVERSRIDTRGYGKSHPVADNTSATNRALNRRVEVYISNDNTPVRARG